MTYDYGREAMLKEKEPEVTDSFHSYVARMPSSW